MEDANFATGSNGLIAVDKIGNQILFLDPGTYATMLTLDAFAPRVHELAISPDHRTAYVPIYGDGIHGKNPRLVRSGGSAACRRFQHLPVSRTARPAVGPAGTAVLRVREQRRRARDGCRNRQH
jgi:hypothetical protein